MSKPPSALCAFADRMPGPVLLLDAAGAVVHCNPALALALGATREALTGRDLLGLIHPDEAAAAREWLQAAARGRAEATLRVRHADGSWRSLDALAAPLAGSEEVARVIVEARDVTEQRRKEDALRRSEERYTLATRGADDGIWDWDLAADRIAYSPRWKSMVGADEDQVSDRPAEWFDRVHPEDVDALKADIAAHLEGRAPASTASTAFSAATAATSGC